MCCFFICNVSPNEKSNKYDYLFRVNHFKSENFLQRNESIQKKSVMSSHFGNNSINCMYDVFVYIHIYCKRYDGIVKLFIFFPLMIFLAKTCQQKCNLVHFFPHLQKVQRFTIYQKGNCWNPSNCMCFFLRIAS